MYVLRTEEVRDFGGHWGYCFVRSPAIGASGVGCDCAFPFWTRCM